MVRRGILRSGLGLVGHCAGGRGLVYLNDRIVSASRETSSSNWTFFTPRSSINEVNTPYDRNENMVSILFLFWTALCKHQRARH